MKKKILFFLMAVLVFMPVKAYEGVEDAIYNNSEISSIANNNTNIEEFYEQFDFKELNEQITNKSFSFEWDNFLSRISNLFLKEIKSNLHIMLILIVMSIAWAIVDNLQNSYNSKSISQTVFFAFYPLFLGFIIIGVNDSIKLASDVIGDEVVFLKTAVPVYTGIIMSMGKVTTAANMEAVFLFSIHLISEFIQKIVLPLVFWISILNMVNYLTEKFSIKKLIDFIKQLIKWMIGIIMTVFIGILGISGITTSLSDGVGMKALKYAMGNFVPVVGGMLSESINTVLASMMVVKNVFGISGVITLSLMCIVPIIKMIVFIIIYKVAAGIIEPIADIKIVNMVNEAGNTISLFFLIMLAVTVMFILGIAIIINAGNKIY